MIVNQTKDEDSGFRLSKEESVAQAEKEAKRSSKGKREAILPYMELTK